MDDSVTLLLFAGSAEGPTGGLRDVVGTFDSFDEACRAFDRLRAAGPERRPWAELVKLRPDGRFETVRWFGRPTPLVPARAGWWQADHQPAPDVASTAVRSRVRSSRRRWFAGPAEAGRPVGATG